MGRPIDPAPTDEQVDTFCRAYVETHSLRASAQAAFPGASRDNSARKGKQLLEEPEVVARLEQLAAEDVRVPVPSGDTARRRIRRTLWGVLQRCLAEEADLTPTATGRAAQLRVELRAQHALRCCHEPVQADCVGCAHNREVFEVLLASVASFRFDAKNALGALEALAKIEGLYIDRKLVGRMSEGDEMLAGLSSHELARQIFVVAVKEWGGDFCHALVDEIAGVAPALPENAGPTVQ